MLELSWKGTRPIQLRNCTTRRFLQDDDEIIFRGKQTIELLRIYNYM